MPKIVDHAQRRSEISHAILRVMAKAGVDGTTIRGIAREGGFSSGALAHYFTNKDEMINFAFGEVAETIFKRIEERLPTVESALGKLSVVVEELLPNGDADLDSMLAIAFWATALHDKSLAAQFHERYEVWRDHLRSCIVLAVQNQEIPAPPQIEDEVDLIVAATDGFLISWTLDPTRFSASRKVRLVKRLLSGLKQHV